MPKAKDRATLESLIASDMRALSAETDHMGRVFAGRHNLAANDFRALLNVMVAETGGSPLTAGELRKRMGVSGAAITYLVERLIGSGHITRQADPDDRRKVILRVADHGRAVARGFFEPLAEHVWAALAHLPDRDLAAAHRTFGALIDALESYRGQLEATSD